MSPDVLTRTLQGFLAEARDAVVFESGEQLFDLSAARYSISDDHGRCVLHLWSEERNVVRRVLEAEIEHDVLHLAVQRFGQSKPAKLEVCRDRDQRTPTARKHSRDSYLRVLRRVIERSFPGWNLERLSSAADLEQGFGPIYARGVLSRGQTSFALLGVNREETQASIDAALTFAILWLDRCRHTAGAFVEGVKLFLPPGTTAVTRARLVHLDHSAAKFQLYEVDEREFGPAQEIDGADFGNIATRLVRCPDREATIRRFSSSVERVRSAAPGTELAVLSTSEVGFRLHGLEFARARIAPEPGSFRTGEQVVFGVGGSETSLNQDNIQDFRDFAEVISKARRPRGAPGHPIYRMQSERWLESLVLRDIRSLDAQLEPDFLYSQVPTFSASDRAMIDVLATTRDRRLAVIELKAGEDIHLPLQGIDYWARVLWHHQRGEFQRFGYFPGVQLSAESPRLLLVAPAFHVHPATDTLLRYLSPEIDCTLAGIHENWREELRVIFRKRAPVRDSVPA